MEINEKLLSFVIPCYRSEMTISNVIHEIIEVMIQNPEYDYEIICINDCSPDNVYGVLKDEATKNERIKVINLASNMGKASAMMAGFSVARGELIVNLDDDCQCPVYDLWKLIESLKNDECDIATASYNKKMESGWKKLGSSVNSLMGRVLLDEPKGLRIENFFAMKRFVMEEMIKYPYPYTYIEGLLLRVTKRIKMIKMEERERGDGKSTGFTFLRSLSLWMNGFTAFSVKPLRFATFVGFISAFIGFISGIVCVFRKIINPDIIIGYTSLLVCFLLMGGLILICIGLIGEYVGRIYICINRSPQYVIRDTINL